MEIMRYVAIGLATSLLLVLFRKQKPEIAMVLSLAAGTMIILLLLPKIALAIKLLSVLALRANVHMVFMGNILKILGISYLAEFGAQVSRDAGEVAVAAKIELAGKVLILVMAIPIINALLQIILRLVP